LKLPIYKEVPASYIQRCLDSSKLLEEELNAAKKVVSLTDSIIHMHYARRHVQDILNYLECFDTMLNIKEEEK